MLIAYASIIEKTTVEVYHCITLQNSVAFQQIKINPTFWKKFPNNPVNLFEGIPNIACVSDNFVCMPLRDEVEIETVG